MFVYVSITRADFFDEYCNEVSLISDNKDLYNIMITSATSFSHVDKFAFDLSDINNENEEIIQAIHGFSRMNPSARVIVVADIIQQQHEYILTDLIDAGVFNIITTHDAHDIKACFTADGKSQADVYDLYVARPVVEEKQQDKTKFITDAFKKLQQQIQQIQRKIVSEPKLKTVKPQSKPQSKLQSKPQVLTAAAQPIQQPKIISNHDFKKHKKYITVGVCGTQSRVGTTHQALLVTKFLRTVGFKSCYLEANNHEHIQTLPNMYNANTNDSINLIQIDAVDMYVRIDTLDITTRDYDFFVFDLGVFDDALLESTDIPILVCGSKSWEFDYLADIITNNVDANIIVNFATDTLHSVMLDSIGDYRNRTYFAEYTPDLFAKNVNVNMYHSIFADYLKTE